MWAIFVRDSILNEIGDDSRTVEYWCRQEWKSIEAHADVDERLAIKEQIYRYPRNGHVLYLQVGSNVRGPTCIFPNCSFGGDLSVEANEKGFVEVSIIPAVEGRLLRFEGSLLHAVPRPADQWMLPFTQVGKTDPENEWGRSVVLFNTWPDTPPQDVAEYSSTEPIETITDDEPKCSTYDEWIDVKMNYEDQSIMDESAGNMKKCKVWLLGDTSRRSHSDRTINLKAPKNLKELLLKEETPTSTFILP